MTHNIEHKIKVEIVTPDKLFFSGEADMVLIPGEAGEFGVLPSHINLISAISPGSVRVINGNDITTNIFVSGGFAEVNATECIVLAEKAINVKDINLTAIKEKLSKLEKELTTKSSDDEFAISQLQSEISELKKMEEIAS